MLPQERAGEEEEVVVVEVVVVKAKAVHHHQHSHRVTNHSDPLTHHLLWGH
jgi:hypothetical protein